MARFSTPSKYLRTADISDVVDTVVTIGSYEQVLVGQGSDAQQKFVLYFNELDKGLVLNATNGKVLTKMLLTDDMDNWIGSKITLYVKDDVQFKDDIVSAIRIRSKRPKEVTA
jgi:hypothetical protein